MNHITIIYVLLSFFVYIILCSLIYMILIGILENKEVKKYKKIANNFEKEILRQLHFIKLNNNIKQIDIDYMNEKLKNKSYIKVFNNVIMEFNKNEYNYLTTKSYMENFEDFILDCIKKSERKDDTKKSYIANILGEYKVSNYHINEFLIKSLDTKSMHLRIIALKSISNIGNIDTFLSAIKYLSIENKYIHSKVFIDILNHFNGDKELLNEYLLKYFYELKEAFQKMIVEYYTKNSVSSVKKEMLERLIDSKTKKETRISIIRYFGKIKSSLAKNEMIRFLNEGEWEYRVVSANALQNYKDEESIKALMNSISDKNWHVRYNSAKTLLYFKDINITLNALEKNDRYSRDILFYVMFENEEISYEEYLEKSRKSGVI